MNAGEDAALMSTAVLILPGIGGSGPQHWQTHWERSIRGARRVAARDWDRPACADWVAALERAVAAAGAGSGVVLVAHSLGCLQVACWARATELAVRGALLVAPPDPEGPLFPTELATGFESLPAAPLPFPSVLIASQDDPYADLGFSRRMAAAWGSRFVDAGRRGHLNAASDLGDWPEGRRWLDRLIAGGTADARGV